MRANRALWIEIENRSCSRIGKTDARVSIDEHDAQRQSGHEPGEIGFVWHVLIGVGGFVALGFVAAAHARDGPSDQRSGCERYHDEQTEPEHGLGRLYDLNI